MPQVRYHDLLFQPDMLSARRDDGEVMRLTRQERALLLRLVRQPNLLVTREQLLDALGSDSADFGERNIDYLVNRLRKRLGDDARSPRFIATQYGEGYVWLPEAEQAKPMSAFLVVGPVFGLAGEQSPVAERMERLARALNSRLSAENPVDYAPDWRPAPGNEDDVAFNLEIATHIEDDIHHLALVLREGRSQRVMQSFRLSLTRQSANRDIEVLADTLVAALWSHAALPGQDDSLPASDPAHLRMHDAATMLTGGVVSWRESDARLRTALDQAPNDPRLTVLLALNGYARLIQSIAEIATAPIDKGAWTIIEVEIESLALSALPAIEDDPLLLLGVAKVLFFVDRGHLDLVERLTAQAFRSGTAFSAVFSMKGQVAAARGKIDQSLMYYDKAIELAEAGSQFHIYLLILKATALMAAGRRTALDHLLTELKDQSPVSFAKLSLFFVPPRANGLPEYLEQMFAALNIPMAQSLLVHLDRTSARHFLRAAHRRDVLSGFATHLERHHGPSVIPAELASVLKSSRKS